MYFNQCHTVGQAKTEYRRLAKLHHPDLGGNTATMQAINAAYHAILQAMDGQTSIGSDKKEHTYHYNRHVEQEIMDKISDLLRLKMPNVEIELIGTWVWIYGDTKPHKERLKELGCLWHGKRQKWYWRRFTHRRRTSNMSFDEMRFAFGAHKFEQEQDRALATI